MTAVASEGAVRRLSYTAAIIAAIVEEMERDESVYCLGTALPKEVSTAFPRRARQTPISEATMTGAAVGAAALGLRPVVFWRNVTFSFVAFDQVANQAAKAHYMLGGQHDFPIVFHAECGGGFGIAAQHSQSPYSIFSHLAGLKVVVPSCASDALGLMKASIRDPNPVVILEPGRLFTTEEDVPVDEHVVPLGKARVRRRGDDVTVVAIGYMVELSLAAAEALGFDGVSVEVVDPRSLVPLDIAGIAESVRRTGRLVIADEAPATCSMASEIAAAVLEDAETFSALRAPVQRVCGLSAPVPFTPVLEGEVLPGSARIESAVRAVMVNA